MGSTSAVRLLAAVLLVLTMGRGSPAWSDPPPAPDPAQPPALSTDERLRQIELALRQFDSTLQSLGRELTNRGPEGSTKSEVAALAEIRRAITALGGFEKRFATVEDALKKLPEQVGAPQVSGSESGAPATPATDRSEGGRKLLQSLHDIAKDATVPEAQESALRALCTLCEHLQQAYAPPPDEDPEGQVLAVARRARIAGLEETEKELAARRDAMAWQSVAGKAVFAVVHAILLVALWASVREFLAAAKYRKKEGPVEIQVSATAASVKTARTGVILLLAALAMYFLYLKFVYPIHVLA